MFYLCKVKKLKNIIVATLTADFVHEILENRHAKGTVINTEDLWK